MKQLKKLVSLVTVLSIFGMATNLQAAPSEYTTDLDGRGYSQGRAAPNYTAATVLALVAGAAIVAVALNNQSHGHGHSH